MSSVRFGGFELDRQTRELTRSGRRVHLPPQAAALLGTAAGDSVERIACQDLSSHDAELNELMDRLREELARLPVRQATAFWIRCVEERSYTEIAQQMKTTPSEVGVLIHRARQQLREALSDLKPNPLNQE